jgi:hypothetical protein
VNCNIAIAKTLFGIDVLQFDLGQLGFEQVLVPLNLLLIGS